MYSCPPLKLNSTTINTTNFDVSDNNDKCLDEKFHTNDYVAQSPQLSLSLSTGMAQSQRRLSSAVNEKTLFEKNTAQETKQRSSLSMGNEDVNDLRKDLMRLMIGEDHLLKIKVQYMEERTALNLQRPVNFQELEQYFQTKYGRLLNFYYTTSTKELMIQVRNQEDLDHVIQLHEHSASSKHRMRLILSQKREQSEQSAFSYNQPPMGMYHATINGGGEITECALSDTSSILSLISTSSSKRTPGGTSNRMNCWPEEEGVNADSTPRPPHNWREGRCLGRGAFGHVFVCLNVDTGEQLVVKKIYMRGNMKQRSRVLATLENELNMLGSLHHPHIVQYFGVVAQPDCINIFMELMAGGSLSDQISEYGAFSETLCIHFGVQILSGLAYLHSKDIVHRDIKPANILRYTRAHVKIGDFGSAKFLQAMCSEQGLDIEGTPHYTAPEIVRDSRRYESRSDVWSVGITLVEMLTTKTPWSGIEPAAVHVRIAYDKPISLATLFSGLSLSCELNAAIELMLRRKPEQRPSAVELLEKKPFKNKEVGLE